MTAFAEAMLKAGLNTEKASETIEENRKRERKEERKRLKRHSPKSVYDYEEATAPDYGVN